MRKMIGAVRFVAALLTLLGLVPVAWCLPHLPEAPRERAVRGISRMVLFVTGVRHTVLGVDLPANTGILLASNHVSFLDILAINALMPAAAVAKAEIARWPLVGGMARSTGTVFINRASRRSLVEAVAAVRKVLQGGHRVFFFPEGTTSDGAGLLPLHANFFEAAVGGIRVHPVVLTYTSAGRYVREAAYLERSLLGTLWDVTCIRDCAVNVRVMPAVTGSDRREICERVRDALQEGLRLERSREK